jgi:threonine/homoserine/homoserine lactone efflux protein
MNGWLPGGASLLAFVLAAVVLAATPGPGVVYIVTRTLNQGRAVGLASVAGVALGNVGNAIGAAFGLAALLALSPAAFLVLKFAGAAYLCVLGWQALRRPRVRANGGGPRKTGPRRALRDGFVVALLNPKTALFFTAFLPQFIDPAGSALGQSAMLGLLFVAIAAGTDAAYALGASAVGPRMSPAGHLATLGRWVSAAVYFGLGLYAALSGAHPARG